MTHVTRRLTAKNRDQLRNPMLGNRVWATSTFLPSTYASEIEHRVWTNKCQLSQIDPRCKIVRRIELDNRCDKLQRSSVGARRHCQLSRPRTVQFITLRASTFLELSWYQTHFDDRYAVAKFSKSRVLSKVPDWSTHILEVPELPYNAV